MPTAQSNLPNTALQRPASPFRVVDSKQRSDLAARRELKFTLPRGDLNQLRRVLQSNGCRIQHNHQISTVNSIYFDDPQLSACYANLHGVGERRKLRLRWYDLPKPEHEFFFEIKWRRNRITGKHRLQLQSSTSLAQMTYREIKQGLIDSVPAALVSDCLRSQEPVAIVQYQREHFVSRDGALRVTLDFGLTFYDQLARQKIHAEFPKRMDDFVVIEGKAPIGRERELRSMLFPLALRVGRCSKYVHGCRHLGHIHENL